MLKIGIDTQSTLGTKTGIGCYVSNLVQQLESSSNHMFCCYKDPAKEDLNTLGRIYWENVKIPQFAKKDSIDLLHVPGFAGPFAKGNFKKVTTVHDLIGLIHPQNLGTVSRFYWQRWLPACIKRSDFIIADSESTKKDIISLLGFSSDRIKVIYLAADSSFRNIEENSTDRDLLKKYNIDRNYILTVGTIEPRKNIPRLIQAYSALFNEGVGKNILLVIVGAKGWDYKKCYDLTCSLEIDKNIVFCDYIDDNDLIVLYNYALTFICPSLYEGFGLPVLEAMQCGAPVICSNISSLPEVAGEAGYYIDPANVDDIKRALLDVIESKDLRDELKRKSLVQSARFSWENTARATLDVYNEVLNEA